jgi:hypothetical protein
MFINRTERQSNAEELDVEVLTVTNQMRRDDIRAIE